MKKSILICALLASACFGKLRADLNNDGYVNFEDFAILASEWNMSDLSANLVAHYKMDDNANSTVVIDEKGNNGTAVCNTSLIHTTGKINGAMRFGDAYIIDGSSFCMTAGTYNGQPSYRELTGYPPPLGGIDIIYKSITTGYWTISEEVEAPWGWQNTSGILGTYTAFGDMTGTRTVTAGGIYVNTNQTFQSTFRDSFAISFWYNLIGSAEQGILCVGFNPSVPTNLMRITLDNGYVVARYMSNTEIVEEGTQNQIFNGGGVDGYKLITVVVRKLSGTTAQIEIYIDGILSNAPVVTTVNMSVFNAATNFYIGDNSGVYDTEGYLDNFMFFNKALSAAEVQELYLSADGGFHRIYSGQDGVIDYNNVVGRMGLNDASVSLANQDLPAGSIWHYIRRQVSECDLESPDSPPCVVVIDSAGEMISNTPNTPANVKIEQVAGGKLRLRWRYIPTGQEIIPTGFNIYMDSGSGFDFDTPLDTVAYRRQIEHSWTSDALTHGQRYKFIVRSYAASAGYSSNTDYVAALADAIGPAAATGVTLNWETV